MCNALLYQPHLDKRIAVGIKPQGRLHAMQMRTDSRRYLSRESRLKRLRWQKRNQGKSKEALRVEQRGQRGSPVNFLASP